MRLEADRQFNVQYRVVASVVSSFGWAASNAYFASALLSNAIWHEIANEMRFRKFPQTTCMLSISVDDLLLGGPELDESTVVTMRQPACPQMCLRKADTPVELKMLTAMGSCLIYLLHSCHDLFKVHNKT